MRTFNTYLLRKPDIFPIFYSGKRLSEIQTKLCLAWFIARDTVPHTTAHRYNCFTVLYLVYQQSAYPSPLSPIWKFNGSS
ncbi:hypothetical protein B1L04_13045 [Microcystis aeruginosa KW]|uniref:Uncharacterized protein n=1 Tax=Microcystis aeruginosa KW TaxID=1960155 RepID=A0A1V4BRG5_MICAE|nr:hypothetical protein B1L04_13045 [Microcystis aeruginosa KW]